MATETNLPDAEGVVRAYLRADAAVVTELGARIFFGVDDPSAYPVAVLQRIGGGLDTTEGLHDEALLQLDVYGDVHDKSGAFDALSACINALNIARNYTAVNTLLLGCNVQSWAFLPDDAERARYSVTFQAYCVPR